MSLKIYEIVTNIIIKKLEAGVVPWRKPWNSSCSNLTRHQNLVSKRPYSGINAFLLENRDFQSSYWLSFKQAQDLGGRVRKGERSTLVVFWKPWESKEVDEDGKPVVIPLLRYYDVFNVSQVEGIDSKRIPTILPPDNDDKLDFNPIEAAEHIMENYKDCPEIHHGKGGAFYRPSTDIICMPTKGDFCNEEEYYSTLFHEAVHSTAHKTRLDRSSVGKVSFGSADYSKEELIAEMGSAFLCAESCIESVTIDNSAAYIGNWLNVLKSDKRMVVYAAAAAQKAVNYIRGLKVQDAD